MSDKQYIVNISDNGRPPSCFPADLDTSDFIEISQVGDQWAKFIDKETGQKHDCKKYHDEMIASGFKIVDETIERLNKVWNG